MSFTPAVSINIESLTYAHNDIKFHITCFVLRQNKLYTNCTCICNLNSCDVASVAVAVVYQQHLGYCSYKHIPQRKASVSDVALKI